MVGRRGSSNVILMYNTEVCWGIAGVNAKSYLPWSFSPLLWHARRGFEKFQNDIASSLFNCDETLLVFNPPCFKVVDQKVSASLSHVTSGDKSKATVLVFVGATGNAYPPMVIFGLKSFNHQLAKGEVPGTSYALSDKSWINVDIFRHWFEQHFCNIFPRLGLSYYYLMGTLLTIHLQLSD